jgi:hypothetical protein
VPTSPPPSPPRTPRLQTPRRLPPRGAPAAPVAAAALLLLTRAARRALRGEQDFRHHAREIWQTGSTDDTFVACDGSGEDPRCSDSLPRWDRSVEAHKWYLGHHMGCKDGPPGRRWGVVR